MTEYIPKNYDNKIFIEYLLSQLCKMGLCCAISGSFPAFTAEMLDSYDIMTLNVAITDSIIVDYILGINGIMVQNFTVVSFVFSHREAYYFSITYNDISLDFKIITLDTLKNCGPLSNLNFVEFLWDASSKEKCTSFAITAVPFPNEIIRVTCFKYYRAASDGLTMRALCYTCTEFHTHHTRKTYSPHTCKLSKDCACNLCLRQPPSLRGLAFQAVFHLTFSIENFKLSPETT